MSYTAVIVPENPTHNGYILTPLVERVLLECGKPKARVSVLANPRTNGYEHAKSLLQSELIARYSYIDLLLFLPDADGKDRAAEFAALELLAQQKETNLICCAAREEVETWLLAGHVERLQLPWTAVRADTSVKENVFCSFLRSYGDDRRPGAGRKELMAITLNNYAGLKMRCPEIADLERRILKGLS